MSIDPIVTRRVLLAAGAGTAGAVALAACSSSSPSKSANSAPDGGAAGSSAGSSSPSSQSSAPAGGASASGDGSALATLTAVPVGGAISVKLPNGKPGIVARPTSSTAVAFSAICTHMGCTVKPAGATLDCPCHGSKYDAKTGKVLGGPAPSPLPKVAVTVKDGKVLPA